MSMNLHCNNVCLIQTPTQITDMCMVQTDGTVAWELKGKKAQHALWIYIKWLEGSQNGSYASSEEADENWKWICAKIESVKKAIKSKNLVVSKV